MCVCRHVCLFNLLLPLGHRILTRCKLIAHLWFNSTFWYLHLYIKWVCVCVCVCVYYRVVAVVGGWDQLSVAYAVRLRL